MLSRLASYWLPIFQFPHVRYRYCTQFMVHPQHKMCCNMEVSFIELLKVGLMVFIQFFHTNLPFAMVQLTSVLLFLYFLIFHYLHFMSFESHFYFLTFRLLHIFWFLIDWLIYVLTLSNRIGLAYQYQLQLLWLF